MDSDGSIGMQFLVDTSPAKLIDLYGHELIGGQLLTPLTRYANHGGVFAVDNGAFSGFERNAFSSLLERNEMHKPRCLFVVVPDVVGSARRTLELWRQRDSFVRGWPLAIVAQDGMEDLECPWDELSTLFIGGGDPWKDSKASKDLVITAKTLGKHVHVGRVNTWRRFKAFSDLGADTCDGSGVAKYDHMLESILTAMRRTKEPGLFDHESVICE